LYLISEDKGIKVLIINGIAWEEEKHTEDLILNADVVMNIWNKSIVKKLIEKEFSIV
jgi:UDP-N-acetylmuramoylalanine--D-glutamate ligase